MFPNPKGEKAQKKQNVMASEGDRPEIFIYIERHRWARSRSRKMFFFPKVRGCLNEFIHTTAHY